MYTIRLLILIEALLILYSSVAKAATIINKLTLLLLEFMNGCFADQEILLINEIIEFKNRNSFCFLKLHFLFLDTLHNSIFNT